MSGEGIGLVLRTHDSSRVADVVLPEDMTADQVILTAIERWKLLADRDYRLQCDRLGRHLVPGAPIGTGGLRAGDELVIAPILEAGATGGRRS